MHLKLIQPKNVKKYIFPCFIILVTCILVNWLFLTMESRDNKYSDEYLFDSGGRLVFDQKWMEQHPVTPLTGGWQWNVSTDGAGDGFRDTIVGQHGSFSMGAAGAAPYGHAVYRLSLSTPPSPEPYMMLIPEVFSACRVRVNGVTVETLGNPGPGAYEPYVRNLLISVPPGDALIEVEAANYTHYYSGMTYPPLFGSVDAVERLAMGQLILYGFLCFFTLGASVISLALWMTHRNKQLYLLYGLMSVSFAVYISYPLTRFMGIRHVRLFYGLEDAAFYGMILFLVLITQLLTGKVQVRFHRLVAAVSLFFCILPMLTGFFLAPMLPAWVNVSGKLIVAYKLGVSLYLIVTALGGLFRFRHSLWLLGASMIFAMGILWDYMTAGRFEPIRGLWQTEYASFFLVLIFMGVVMQNYRRLVTENARLTGHLEEEVEKKTEYLTVLLNERRQLLAGAAHDMKAPIAVIRAYIDLIRMGNVQIDQATREYISVIDRKSSSLSEQISTLQAFHEDYTPFCPSERCLLSEFLQQVYEETGMYAEAKGVYFHLELPKGDAQIEIRRDRLLRAMENIILNASEHTPAEGSITVRARVQDGRAVITVRDTGCGIKESDLPRIFEYQFSGKTEEEKEGSVRGIGLYFARAAILEHGGAIDVESRPGEGAEFTVMLPLVP